MDHDATNDLHTLNKIARLSAKLGEQTRATLDLRDEPETDTTHTIMLALAVMQFCPQGLNRYKALAYALVHDLPEAYAGDVSTLRPLTPEERAAKDEAEARATERIANDLPDIAEAIRSYEAQESKEAQFVKVLDKVLPKLTHAWNGCKVPRAEGVTREELVTLHDDQMLHLMRTCDLAPVVAFRLFHEASAHALRAFDDQVAKEAAELIRGRAAQEANFDNHGSR